MTKSSRRLLVGLAAGAVSLAGFATGGTTYAAFSDFVVIEGNQVSAGLEPEDLHEPGAAWKPVHHHDAEVAKTKLANQKRGRRHWKTKMWKRRTKMRQERAEAFRDRVRRQATDSLEEPGCRRFDVWCDTGDCSRVFLFEIYDDRAAFVKLWADVDALIGWTTGALAFRGTPLRDVVPELEGWFDLQIRIADSGLGDRRITATFHGERGQEGSAG